MGVNLPPPQNPVPEMGVNGKRVRPRFRPRWRKILSDLWGNRVRTLLVVSSVTVGLFAVGMIATTHGILTQDMRAGYAAHNPANIIIQAGGFDDEIVDMAQQEEGVKEAEGVRTFDLMARSGSEEWTRIGVQAQDNLEDVRINKVELLSGTWPPDDREIVIETHKLRELFLTQGEDGPMVELKLPSGKIRRLRLVGTVQDQTLGLGEAGGFFLAPVHGYVTYGTLEWLEQAEEYNRLVATVTENPDEKRHLRDVANQISQAMEDENVLVYNSRVYGSHEHPNVAYVDAMTGVLFVLGGLVMFLSAFLITNTLQALLNQQSQQIAIMKTVGARSYQVTVIYVVLILVYGLLALAISLPLSQSAAFRLVDFLSAAINAEVQAYRTMPLAVYLQVIIALIVPQVAGIVPILQGARVKIHTVLAGSLIESDPERRGWIDRWLAQVKGLSRPLLISLRNTFRHRGRLALTLVTLTLGGAVFIGTFNARAALDDYISRIGHYFMADVNLTTDTSYRITEIQEALAEVPGVQRVEGWAYGRSELLLADDRAGDAISLLGPPANSDLIDPILIKGRWIVPGDEGAIVLSERFLSEYPDLEVGDTLPLRVNGEKTEWVVVGFFQLAGKSAGYVAYTTYEYLASLVGEENRAPTFRVIAEKENMTLEEQQALGAQIESALQARGFGVIEVSAGRSLLENTSRPLDTLTIFLLIMAILTALVGSIGLMGTMSMNVLDRTREIGVMRAIGASDRDVMSLVLVEGVMIGLISWIASIVVAVPISKLLSDTIHRAIFDALAEFTFTPVGPLAWLAVVIVLSIIASAIPARSAARLTIREALAYE